MVNAALLIAIVGVVTLANANPVAEPNWMIAGDPKLAFNNPAVEMLKRMGVNINIPDFSNLPDTDSMTSTIINGGGKGFRGIATSIKSTGHLDKDGKWVQDVQGSTTVNNEGDVRTYDLNDGPVVVD